MTQEAYVSFTVAKLLKEKGFKPRLIDINDVDMMPLHCHAYMTEGKEVWGVYHVDYYSCPTQQMACRWLRNEKGIHIMPTIGCDVDRTPRIFYRVIIALFNDYGDIDYRDPIDDSYDEPEDAVEAALKYVLNELL